MANNITEMPLADVMAHAPRQRNLKETEEDDRGLWVTFSQGYGFMDTPVYREPSHLAAWLIGYWSGQASAEKENN